MATGTLGTSARDYPSRVERFVFPLTVTNLGGAASVKIGTVPAGSGLMRCTTIVGTAFTAGATVQLGTAPSGAQIVAAAAPGAVGINSQTIIAAQAGPLAADTAIWLTNAGTAAAAGNGLLVLEWGNPGAG